ncbi:hypothetical protein BV898_16371 [Hypsibius exemplaris]|uniref:Uncharacterized protein n=1 Tax=Hypsibius exemplaris TaxID=2072580 RepID=A0A9X6NDJ1_HYPEX|nr:hypothetical protein BV898_16371 [Hypsibius exemplaris]
MVCIVVFGVAFHGIGVISFFRRRMQRTPLSINIVHLFSLNVVSALTQQVMNSIGVFYSGRRGWLLGNRACDLYLFWLWIYVFFMELPLCLMDRTIYRQPVDQRLHHQFTGTASLQRGGSVGQIDSARRHGIGGLRRGDRRQNSAAKTFAVSAQLTTPFPSRCCSMRRDPVIVAVVPVPRAPDRDLRRSAIPAAFLS